MSDLTGFLLARISEDETDARAATPGPWTVNASDRGIIANGEIPTVVVFGDQWGQSRDTEPEDMPHIARWNPARVLAECEAKRRIIAAHSQPRPYVIAGVMEQPEPWQATQCRSCGYSEKWQSEQYGGTFPCPTLRFLAAPYSDHVDFDPVWVVSGE